jgi:hypothetical protein
MFTIKRALLLLVVLPVCGGSAGCTHILDAVTGSAVALAGAEDPTITATTAPSDAGNPKKQYVGEILAQSEKNCQEFVARFTVGEKSTDSILDIGTTVASA